MKRLPVATLLLAGALVTGALRRIRNVDGFCERRSGSIDHLPRRHLAFAVGPGRHRADHDDRLARFLRGASRRERSTPLPRHAASLIDKTWLGPADEVGDEISGEKFKGSKPRKWCSKDGEHILVFTAYVLDSEVVKNEKSALSKPYWYDGSVTGRDLPDLYGTGESAPESAKTAKPDPNGWDDPDDYADDCSGYFANRSEAYDYWCEEMSYEE